MKLLDIMTGPWAIVPSRLAEIQGIYEAHVRGPKIDLKGVEAAIGRPLANEHQAYEVIDGAAVIPVTGVLGKGMSLLTKISGGTSTARLQEDLRAAIDDPTVRSIILRIDSPGGAVDGTQELADAVFDARSQPKPIVALADGCMCSAAYWIGAAASQVFITSDTTQVGSIGVVASHQDISKAEASQGVVTTEITAGKYKRIASQHGPLTEEGRASIQDHVDHVYSVFVDQVAKFRGVSVETVLSEMADGRVFLGRQAKEAGLVDGVSTLAGLISDLSRGTVVLVSPGAVAPPPQPNAKEALMPITREQLQVENLDLLNTLISEGTAKGAAAELARIQGVFAASLPGHDALVQSLAFDGKTTPGEAAMAVLAAEKANLSTEHKAMAAGAPPPVAHSDPPEDQESPEAKEANLPIEQRCQARWDRDPSIREEFGAFEGYLAYEKADANGQVKNLRSKE